MTTTTAEQPKKRGRPPGTKGRPPGEDRKPLSNYIDAGLFKNLDEISSKTRISKAKLLDKSIELLVQHYHENNKTIVYNK